MNVRNILCPKCGAMNHIEESEPQPTLVLKGEVYLPTLVAIRCDNCSFEIRLDGDK